MVSMEENLVPQPQRYTDAEGTFIFPDVVLIQIENAVQTVRPIAQRLQEVLADHGVDATITAMARQIMDPHVTLRIDPVHATHSQGYRLDVTPDQIALTGADAAGLFYGVCTLAQIVMSRGDGGEIRVPAVRIEDWPDFPARGVMLDVSRDRVPTMDTLYELVDLLASWKINQLQLYMEHTFAYRGHEVVWEGASPFTGEEIMALDAYCRERFVELVPNQNSFGHMHRWLIHDPYRQLAECPEGCELWPGHGGEPFSLCPIDAGSVELLADLYDQLLPHFSSSLFNVGLDETFDLGKGRSAEVCEEQGTERVYLDFLKKVHELARARGKTMQFWGDIILHKPELIPELPSDAIAMEWGYEARHPFTERASKFADAGLRFYVCPGTSSWNTIGGRSDNALVNIEAAAMSGKQYGAVGLLNTDWGDNGHVQPLPISYLGFLAGAAMSWNADTILSEIDIPGSLDRFAFFDDAGVMGQAAYDLGNVYKLPGVEPSNASVLFLLLFYPDRALDQGYMAQLDRDGLANAVSYLSEIRERLDEAEMARADADLVTKEFVWAADVLRWAAELGLARLQYEATETAASLPEEVRAELAGILEGLIERHRDLWLRRSRPGGLDDSVARLQRVLDVLRA